jgi:uncharacterized protein (UPF0332 family)
MSAYGHRMMPMDAGEQVRRWTNAKEKLQVAHLCYDQQFYGESLTRSYYACYQAMWAALGDPALGLWRHGGLINEFCRGQWTTPPLLPTALAALRKKLDDLYRLRIAVDYATASASHTQAAFGLDVVKETLHLIAHHMGWVL